MTDYSQINWSDSVTAALADINDTKEKSKPKKYEKKVTDLTKYFSTSLEKTEKTGTKNFRMIPTVSNPLKFAEEVYFHYLLVGKKWTKIYDPSQNSTIDVESPLNDARKALNANSDESIRKSAAKYKPKLFYIIRGIDRANEADGVKFWRFGASSGTMDKIESLINFYNSKKPGGGAFWNPIAGRDLSISLTKDEIKGYSEITNIIVSDIEPLSGDTEKMNLWLSDTTTWKDVYKTNSTLEYLRIIADGHEPVWNKECNEGKGGHVAKELEEAMTTPAAIASAPVQTAPTAQVETEVASNEVVMDVMVDDLPF